MATFVALSGGKASAWCANWALQTFPKEDVILYFNDTKWEHSDLYRFLGDLEKYFNHSITYDSDGRTPEELFYAHHALANDRMPFCSQELKAKRLQAFYQDNDNIVFGISKDEAHRAKRLVFRYQDIANSNGRYPRLLFPLIDNNVTRKEINQFLVSAGIEEPFLYKLGFSHNNCSGGCVRAGKKQWKLLYDKLPEVYAERERVEETFMRMFNKRAHFLKDETLKEFRLRIESGNLSSYYSDPEEEISECIRICNSQA